MKWAVRSFARPGPIRGKGSSAATLLAYFLTGGCSLVSTPHRPLRLEAREPRASAIETSVAALADPRSREAVRRRCVEIHPDFTLTFVEFDDQGRFWNRGQLDLLERTLEKEDRRADTSGLVVIVFAHGWRHDPDVCDGNVACFRTLLAQAHADSAEIAHVAGGGTRPKRLVAVYAGWRGLSMRVQPFEDLSFWARKRVSHRIADGDLTELLTRVELFVRRANADDPDRARLVVIGHSLGATMVHAALANILKARVLEALDCQDRSDARESVIRGFGDLVVLINPAFEASLYAPLHELAGRFRRFSPLQSPVLITIASETDRPNGFWFPLGRRIETLFERTGDRSPRREIVTAVGNYPEFWTHRLTAAVPSSGSRPWTGAFGATSSHCGCELPLEPIDSAEAASLTSLLLGNRSLAPAPGGATSPYGRARLTAMKPIDPRNPFWVVRASDEVVHGHSGIFTTYLVDFVRRVLIESNARHNRGDNTPAGRLSP